VTSGSIEAAVDPASAGRAGYWRAVGHLTALQRALSAAHDESRTPVSVLFIDSGLWARLTPAADGFSMDVHTDGAKPGDAVVVTSEPVLAAILEKRLSAADALERGLIAVDGSAAEHYRRAMTTAFETPAPPADGGMRAVRMFGPR
jgi:hypothetical protein